MDTLKYFICGILVLNLGALVVASEGDEIMIDNFESNSEVRWEYFSDQVMGGVSEGAASFGSDNGEAYVQMTGDVSTANNGGFIQLRTKLASGADKNAQGIYIKVRGNDQKYYIHLRTRGTMLPWQYYQAGLDVTDDWKIIRVPLENFKPSGSWLRKAAVPTSIRSIGVVAFGRNHQADIQISEIGFY
jgi:hypothetical protein